MCSNANKDTQQPLKTIFLSGSRSISRLNDRICERVQKIIDNGFRVIIGDANGADKALQKYLADSGYKNVVVFCSGATCRNNFGGWEIQRIQVDPSLKGRAFYSQKDKEMAVKADYGLILWDGKSAGSINNVFELLKICKTAVVYFSIDRNFHNIKRLQDVKNLLDQCDQKSIDIIKKKVKLDMVINDMQVASQTVFTF